MDNHIPGCTGKRIYETPEDAYKVQEKIRANQYKFTRQYLCPHCGKYHITTHINPLRRLQK